MAKNKDQPSQPTSLPTSQPPGGMGADLGPWVLNAITRTEGTLGRLEASLVSLRDQLTRVETKLVDVDREVQGHGKWMHTLKVFAGVILAAIIWLLVNAAWPLLKTKLGIP